MITKIFSFAAILSLGISISISSQTNRSLVVKADQPKADIQPAMWGVFFEDINFAADGGIYAELVKNRSFEFKSPLTGWKEIIQGDAKGRLLIINQENEKPSNPRVLNIKADAMKGAFGISNEGFRGMGIRKDNQYNFSILARSIEGKVKLLVELINASGQKIGEATLENFTSEWGKYSTSFKASATDPKALLNVLFVGKGEIEVDMVSLFPKDTWKNRPNGLRPDIVQLLADMKPGFIRFPGGCIVEGFDLDNRYQWKNTIGNIEDRKTIISRWNTEFKHRLTADYYQSFGLGFYEYFQLAEDLGAEPLPILNCGMACQFNSAEVVPVDKLDPYIQDALDLIEFANGGVESKWGGLRAKMGHPAPFKMRLLGVGNEQWGEQYIERYKVMSKALKEKHPEITLISDPGPSPDGEMFEYLWGELRKLNADIVDEHYYQNPSWFLNNVKRYDNYDRKGPKVFAGEYAVQTVATTSPDNKNNWQSALSEAAYMTGLERNADIVYMASYAPLFAHSEGWQWTPDLIWFDNLHVYGTPNYYVQKLFSTNKGTQVLPLLYQDKPVTGQDSLYASAVIDKNTREIIVKIVNTSNKTQTGKVIIETAKELSSKAKVLILKSNKLDEMNSFDNPKQISPVEELINVSGKEVSISLTPYSFSVFRVALL
jgi:alpha-L-arabinofuranosidase